MDNSKDNFTILVVSADRDTRKRWCDALASCPCTHEVAGLRQARQALHQHRTDLIVLDGDLLHRGGPHALALLSAGSPDVRALLMDNGELEAERIAAVKAGVVGYCERDAGPALMMRAVTAIRNGEVWLPRAFIARLIDVIATNPESGPDAPTDEQRQWLGTLTARELDVARLVYQSANNKVIARKLNISERTVKAHLSAIFRKLHVANRVHLALLFKELS